MRTYFKLVFVLFIVLTSCQKVIDVNLNEADPIVSIDAVYNATEESVVVKLGLSSNFFSNEESPAINNATVTIEDQNGNLSTIPNQGNGIYELQNYVPNYNSTYILKVDYDNTVYTASSFLPEVVDLAFLTSFFQEEDLFGDAGYVVFMNVVNDQSKDLFFRAVPSLNDTLLFEADDLFLFDNDLAGPGIVPIPLFTERFQLTDTIDIELRSFNEATYKYYNELSSILSNQSAAPTNPTTNWDNGALGLFQTWGFSTERIIIQ